MPWERCFGRATDGIRQERYISIQLISKVLFRMGCTANATSKTVAELLFVGLQSGTVPSASSASEIYSLRTKQEDVVYKINHIFVGRTVQH